MLVTSGIGGIGRARAERLALQPLNLCNAESLKRCGMEVEKNYGHTNIVVNNTAVGSISVADWQLILMSSLTNFFRCNSRCVNGIRREVRLNVKTLNKSIWLRLYHN